MWLTGLNEATPVMVVPIFNAFDDVRECVDTLLVNTASNAPILLIDDCSTDERVQQLGESLAAAHPARLMYVRKESNSGFVGSVNLAFEATHPHDVVVINSDVILPPRWLERLHAAAYVRTNIATVTPFTNHGTMVSLPYRNRPTGDLPDGLSLSEVDARIERASLHQYPPIPTAIGHCTYFRRAALDVVGFFDEAFAPGYGEEVDFSQRAVTHGFINIVADDLFVHHKGSRSFDAAGVLRREKIQTAHEKLLHARYPWYTGWMRAESNALYSPLADAISRARRALLPTRVAIDATYIAPTTTGTSVVAFEMIRALASAPQRVGRLFVVVQSGAASAFKARIGEIVDGVYALDELEQMDAPMFDLVFRPAQVQRREELMRLQSMAERFVVFQLDFIAYANPAYASSYEAWMEYRHLTAEMLAVADGVGYLSKDVVVDGVRHGLAVPESRTCVFHSGVDHFFHLSHNQQFPAFTRLKSTPFLLVLGTNFRHKNRVHALLIFEQLTKLTNWPGSLVFAGPQVSHGGSTHEEQLLKERLTAIADRIIDLGAVDEGEKAWLLKNAALVLYPSVCEGFGLIPFEAAAHGTATIPARSTSLQELLGENILYFDTFDPAKNADLVNTMLANSEVLQRQTQMILRYGEQYQWSSVAGIVWQFLQQTIDAQPRAHLIRQELASMSRYETGIGPKTFQETAPLWKRWQRRVRKVVTALQSGDYRNILFELRQYLRWKLGP